MCNWKQSRGVGWEIRKDGGMTVTVDSPSTLFNMVWQMTDQETAIEVDGWEELATVGEVYETRDIVIEVVEL